MGWSEVEQAFNDAVEQRVIPGATVVVRRGADVAFEGAFGFRSIEPNQSPAKIETVYDLSSLTKATHASTTNLLKCFQLIVNGE